MQQLELHEFGVRDTDAGVNVFVQVGSHPTNYNLLKVFHFSRGILPSWDVWYDSWEVVLPREASGGFDFSRGKNQTKLTPHEETVNHTILTSHEGQHQTILLLTSIKTIPSLHLTSIKTKPFWHLTRDQNHTISTSHEYQNHTISTSHEGSKPYHLDISRDSPSFRC